MSDGSVRTSEFPAKTALGAADSVVVNVTASNGVTNTCLATVTTLLNASNVTSICIPNSAPPANSTANGVPGTIVWDSSYIYLCVANNSWRRFAGGTF